ncbi:MAG: hypothetical protein JST67_03920 [Bacteroidetes bacterium]|nr:hypothetical protein [Bacteroidota bacterium]
MKKCLFVYLFFILLGGKVISQEDSLVPPTVITLKDGVYLSYKDLQTNNPLPKENILIEADKSQPDFILKTLSNEKEIVFTYKGAKYRAETARTWGFCQNGILYINFKGQFSRVTLFGSISHFMATIMVTRYVSNYYNYGWGGGFYGNGMYGMGSPSVPVKQAETHEFLLDFATGNIDESTPSYLETLLSRDMKIYTQYANLRRKQRRDLMIFYIRRYNEEHPIVFQEPDGAK